MGDSEDSYAYDGGRICKWNVEGKVAASEHTRLLKKGHFAKADRGSVSMYVLLGVGWGMYMAECVPLVRVLDGFYVA